MKKITGLALTGALVLTLAVAEDAPLQVVQDNQGSRLT
ncbi:MAG: hypothetical protein H6Q72_4471 [Firmicutes bacterium]|nr:hypothetical protein [Bacillota bacterium]